MRVEPYSWTPCGPGVQAIFGNPGTTEVALDSLADYPDIRYITTLQRPSR
jgi:thiamine pyrophosphate-dependent acetolactate synthase large subunit-like protein